MNKSIRNLALTTALLLTASPMFANRTGTDPHPQLLSIGISLGDYASIVLSIVGL
jgi:hypothetical protein